VFYLIRVQTDLLEPTSRISNHPKCDIVRKPRRHEVNVLHTKYHISFICYFRCAISALKRLYKLFWHYCLLFLCSKWTC